MYLKDIVANYLPNIKLHHDFLVIGITGNISSGKSTFASYLKKKLQQTFLLDTVETISTDDFLFNNNHLKSKNLFDKKGCVDSYDQDKVNTFFNELKTDGQGMLQGKYNQQTGDMNQTNYIVSTPSILIIEGTMTMTPLFRDFIDLTIFLDVDLETNYDWFKERSLNNLAYKKEYAHLTIEEATPIIQSIWQNTNLKTYYNYVQPYQYLADVQVNINQFHEIDRIILKKADDSFLLN